MRAVRFPSRGLLAARAWQALRRGPFFIAGWVFLVPAAAIAVLMVLSAVLLFVTMVITGEWGALRVLAGMLVSASLQLLGLLGALVVALAINDRLLYLAYPSLPRDPRQASKRRFVDAARGGRSR